MVTSPTRPAARGEASSTWIWSSRGEILGFVGPYGAGKTTTIRLLMDGRGLCSSASSPCWPEWWTSPASIGALVVVASTAGATLDTAGLGRLAVGGGLLGALLAAGLAERTPKVA